MSPSRRAALSLGVALVGTPVTAQITVGPEVAVSRSHADRDHTEILVAADPRNPDRLLVCTMLWSGEKAQLSTGIYASFDRGRTWRLTKDDAVDDGDVWDPTCIYGHDGVAYFSTLPTKNVSRDSSAIMIYRSEDGGASWGGGVRLRFIDRPYLTVDRTGGRFHGRLYLHANGASDDTGSLARREMHLLHSIDGGRTFRGPVANPVPDDQVYRLTIPGAGSVLADGTLLMPYWTMRAPKSAPPPAPGQALPPNYLEVVSTTDGGETLTKPTVVTQLLQCRESVSPVMDVDRSGGAFAGRVYLVFGDRRGVQDRVPRRRPGRCEIMLTHSDDGGRSWSAPVRVDDARAWPDSGTGPDAFLPSLAVNKDGVVGVAWYDRREDRSNRRHRYRFAASVDGGESFLSSVPVSKHAYSFESPERYAINPLVTGGGMRRASQKTDVISTAVITAPRIYDSVGDTGGMAADATGTFHAFWTDNRDLTVGLYTAPITVAGRAVKHGAPDLAALANVTRRVELRYSRAVYDQASRTVTLDARLHNSSAEPLVAPLRLRALRLSSDLGTPVALNADNGATRSGVVWDFTPTLTNGSLAPGQWSRAKALRFRIDDLEPFAGKPRGLVVTFDANVFAAPSPAAR